MSFFVINKKKWLNVQTVGRIDKAIYRCVSDNITTDEVVITDERISHVRERHLNDFEKFFSYIPMIIADPDYIIEANKPNTAVLLKEIIDNGKKVKLVLRISVKNDPKGYKNSIITFMHIGDKTWKKTLKNKNILYTKE